MKAARLHRFHEGLVVEDVDERSRRAHDPAAQGRVRLETTRYPLEAIGDAMDDLSSGRLQGRGIVVPEPAGG